MASALATAFRSARAAPALRQAMCRTAPAAVVSRRHLSQTTPTQSMLTSKTGQTGTAVLGAGLAAYLVSKEVLILHNESIVVFSVGAITYFLIKKAGGSVAEMLDSRAKSIFDTLSVSRDARIEGIKDDIQTQKSLANVMDGVKEIFDVNRELSEMTRELAFRMEKKAARDAAVKQLEDFVKLEAEERAREQAELVAHLEAAVLEGLKGQEDVILKQCIADLEKMAASA